MIEVDSREDGNCPGKFGRIRVMLDITKPLRQGVWIRQEKSEEDLCIILLHERLPQFCYVCGCLGHGLKDCSDSRGESS